MRNRTHVILIHRTDPWIEGITCNKHTFLCKMLDVLGEWFLTFVLGK